MYIKPSLMAENDLAIQHANRQSHVVLQKTLSHMQTMEKQVANKSSLEQKMLARRLRANLDRSAKMESNINILKGKIKSESNYYKESNFIQAVKFSWAEDNFSKERSSQAQASVVIPTAINLLVSNGYTINPRVIKKCCDLQRCASFSKIDKRRSSLPNLQDKTPRRIATSPSQKVSPSRKHPRESISSSSSSTSSQRPSKRKIQKLKDFNSASSLQNGQKNCTRKTRPITAPELTTLETSDKMKSTVAWVKSVENTITHKNEHLNNNESNVTTIPVNCNSVDESRLNDFRIYHEQDGALENLHLKLNANMEEINIIDIHRAQMASRNMPRRMKSLMSNMENYKISDKHGSNVPGSSVDYYSYCMRKKYKDDKKTCHSRASDSCLITSLSSIASSEDCLHNAPHFNCVEDVDTGSEIHYYNRVCKSMAEVKNQSLTLKPLRKNETKSEMISYMDY